MPTQIIGPVRELCIAAAQGIAGIPGTAVFSFSSDGTYGPADVTGGCVDYEITGLIITGSTGTNVNNAAVALLTG